MGREKRRTETCDLSAKFFLLPPQQNPKKSLSLSEIFGRGNENKNDGLPPASWRHNQFGTKKKNYKQNKKERCVSSQQLMNNFRLGRGWWTICHLPGDNSGLNTKKELGKCFLINLGRWSSFVGSWGQKAVFGFWNSLNGGKRKKKHLPTSDSSTSLPHERKTNETKRPCDIVPNSLCYVNVRCIKIELCGYVVLSLIGVCVWLGERVAPCCCNSPSKWRARRMEITREKSATFRQLPGILFMGFHESEEVLFEKENVFLKIIVIIILMK